MENINELLLHSKTKEEIIGLKQHILGVENNHSKLTNEDRLLNKVRLMRAHILLWEIDEAEVISAELRERTHEMTVEIIYFYHKYNGNIAYARKHFELSLLLYLQAYEVIPETTRNSLQGLEIADLHYSICLAAQWTSHLDLVEEHSPIALEIYENNDNLKRVSELYTNMSIVESKLMNFQRSLKCLEKALYYARSTNCWKVRFPALYNYALACMKFKNYDKCIQNCEIGIQAMPESMKFERFVLFLLQAKAFRDQKNLSAANETILKAGYVLESMEEHEKPMLHFEDFLMEYKVAKLHILGYTEEYVKFMKAEFLPRIEKIGNDYDIRYYYKQLNEFFIERNDIEGIMSILLKVNELLLRSDSNVAT